MIASTGDWAKELDEAIQDLSNRHARLSQNTSEVTTETARAQKAFLSFGGTLDGVGGNVDNLIGKLQSLKKVQLDALLLSQRLELSKNEQALGQAQQNKSSAGQTAANYAGNAAYSLSTNDRNRLTPEARAAIADLKNGKVKSDDDIQRVLGVLENSKGRLSSSGQGYLSHIIDSVSSYGGAALTVDQTSAKVAWCQTDNSPYHLPGRSARPSGVAGRASRGASPPASDHRRAKAFALAEEQPRRQARRRAPTDRAPG